MDSEIIQVYVVNMHHIDVEAFTKRYPLSGASLIHLQQRRTTIAQQHFRISRALIQHLAYQKLGPSSQPFELIETETGPQIQCQPHYHISLSHSHDFVAVCLSQDKVAIDIEHAIKTRPYLKIAQFAFHPDEYQWMIQDTVDSTLQDRFYYLWTLRECFYKLGFMQTLADQSFSTLTQENYRDCSRRSDLYLACIQARSSQQNTVHFLFDQIDV